METFKFLSKVMDIRLLKTPILSWKVWKAIVLLDWLYDRLEF